MFWALENSFYHGERTYHHNTSLYVDYDLQKQLNYASNFLFVIYLILSKMNQLGLNFNNLESFQSKSNVYSILDGFMSSLGCKTKERIGHLYRGRDCENNVVDDTFERKCYCRYHWCNHPDYYYGGGQALWQSSWIVFSISFIIQHCFR